jgi:uncharacterized cupredoxin-like copper-binding protein
MKKRWKFILLMFGVGSLLLGGWVWNQGHELSVPTIGRVTIAIESEGFNPAKLKYTEGEEVSLFVINKAEHVHNLIIPDFHIFSANLKPGESTTISFQAVKKGRFGYFSDAPGFPEPGFHGEIVVK